MSHYNVLFLCADNSARSIMAEAIMNRKGRGNFTAFSAGSYPTATVRPEAIRQVEKVGLDAVGARSKSSAEFSTPDSPHLSFLFSVCDNAANEVSDLARTAIDSPLGNSPSRCRARQLGRDRPCL